MSPPGRPSTPRVARLKNRSQLGYRRIVQLLVTLVLGPTVLLLSLGILLMFLEERINLLFGILTVSFVAVLVTGAILIWVFVRRESRLSELQADFVAKVSHELKTPLTAIRLFIETMERSPADEATRARCLALLSAESERLTRLIERLLDWGRMEAGGKLYELRPESLGEIVGEAVAAFGPERLGDAALAVSLEVEPDLPLVDVDRHAIVDALSNLLSNARKYGGQPPRAEVRAFRAGAEVAVAVKDHGGGIPRGEHGRIFEKFYRIDDRLSRAREGSGLGLAIVKHVARAHGARVKVDSEPGRGSTFTLFLPRADAPAGRLPPDGGPATKGGAPTDGREVQA